MKSPEELDAGRMTFFDHLAELRKRLIYVIIAVVVGIAVCWFFIEDVFRVMMLPMIDVLGPDKKMIFTSPTEAFVTYLKVAALAGVLVSTPVWMFQLWRFVAPGLFKNERIYIALFVFFGSFFFLGGAMFGYFEIIPYGYKFLIGNFHSDFYEALPTLKDTFSLSLKLLIAFGIAFELPVVIFFLARMGIVSAGWLLKKFRYAVLIIFVLAAIFTPPDVITQIGLGIPLCILYLLGVFVAFLFGKKKPSTGATSTD